VQCSSFGHPVTSGIRNIDYFISTENWEPENGDEHYSERLIRLKSPIAYYSKPAVPHLLKTRSQFGLADAEHIYICPQALFKFHPDFDGILAGILHADPLARLLLVNGVDAHWTELLVQRFKRTMPKVAHRVTVMMPQPGSDFINLIAVSDVMLDTIHFGGYTTNLEAFAVGTPVVTWPGAFQRGRHTLAFYKEMGFLDCVAGTPLEYISIAVRLGTDSMYRQAIKDKILANNHVLYEDMNVVREYEKFFVAAVEVARETARVHP
jgi:predicted O-linked N-acetylglucosamine transferase (SPINDLY family)